MASYPIPAVVEVRYSHIKILAWMGALFFMIYIYIWLIIKPWIISILYPDMVGNKENFGIMILAPFFIAFFLLCLAGFSHHLRRAFAGPIAIINDKGIYSRQWGFTIFWDEIKHVTAFKSDLFGPIVYLNITAPALLKPMRTNKIPILSFMFNNGSSDSVTLPYLLIWCPSEMVDALRHHLGKRCRV